MQAYDPEYGYAPGAILGYPLLIEGGRELQREGVRFLDLTMVFGDVNETIYVDDCCDFNQLGNEVVARALAQFILSHME